VKKAAVFLTSALALASGAAHADFPFSHPSVGLHGPRTTGAAQAQESSPVLIGHAASPHWIVVHANQEHPAVVQARLAATPHVDPNTLLVQPPASVQWTLGPVADAPVVASAR
jgi:hypothetical protein